MSHGESEEEIAARALRYIRRHSEREAEWKFSVLAALAPGISLSLRGGELPIMAAYISGASWYVLTTRRLVSQHHERHATLPVSEIRDVNFGNFKGISPNGEPGFQMTETATIHPGGELQPVTVEFETLHPGIAFMYACRFWEREEWLRRKRAQ